jgi:hypothetical protein
MGDGRCRPDPEDARAVRRLACPMRGR